MDGSVIADSDSTHNWVVCGYVAFATLAVIPSTFLSYYPKPKQKLFLSLSLYDLLLGISEDVCLFSLNMKYPDAIYALSRYGVLLSGIMVPY